MTACFEINNHLVFLYSLHTLPSLHMGHFLRKHICFLSDGLMRDNFQTVERIVKPTVRCRSKRNRRTWKWSIFGTVRHIGSAPRGAASSALCRRRRVAALQIHWSRVAPHCGTPNSGMSQNEQPQMTQIIENGANSVTRRSKFKLV